MWEVNDINGWNIDGTLKHDRYYKVCTTKTWSKRIEQNMDFLHYGKMVQLSSTNASVYNVTNIGWDLWNTAPNKRLASDRDKKLVAIPKLTKMFNVRTLNSSKKNPTSDQPLPAAPVPITAVPPNITESLPPRQYPKVLVTSALPILAVTEITLRVSTPTPYRISSEMIQVR